MGGVRDIGRGGGGEHEEGGGAKEEGGAMVGDGGAGGWGVGGKYLIYCRKST